MNILCVGDVVGSSGCKFLRNLLPGIKQEYSVDVCIVNGENAADGNGLTLSAAQHMFDSGADVITGGNHIFRRQELYEMLDSSPTLLRPANYPSSAPGNGVCIIDRGSYQVTIINLIGVVYMEPLACPFDTLDILINQAGNPKFCIVDFHAEATAEKKALAYHADGRISALFGTHTHVQTADEQILPGGTGFITDAGMTGPLNSVLGIRPEQAIAKMHGKLPVRFSTADGPCMLNAVVITLSDMTGKTTSIKRLIIK
ncbi:MAG: TIGR00282 family metallophosphoesterase [Oscillospiraceae bacterium]|nr:TIGR00282 family metallophosphoesterase [Oscillospiraceae bacterium]MDD4414464.1 TIGR00282 family metallophosphoesterase [Oscillospiraceae bacterium]